MVSGSWWQQGHMGESAFDIWCRYAARGIWPMRSCVRMLPCLRGSFFNSSQYFCEGALSDVVRFMRWNCGEFVNIFVAATFSLA